MSVSAIGMTISASLRKPGTGRNLALPGSKFIPARKMTITDFETIAVLRIVWVGDEDALALALRQAVEILNPRMSRRLKRTADMPAAAPPGLASAPWLL